MEWQGGRPGRWQLLCGLAVDLGLVSLRMKFERQFPAANRADLVTKLGLERVADCYIRCANRKKSAQHFNGIESLLKVSMVFDSFSDKGLVTSIKSRMPAATAPRPIRPLMGSYSSSVSPFGETRLPDQIGWCSSFEECYY